MNRTQACVTFKSLGFRSLCHALSDRRGTVADWWSTIAGVLAALSPHLAYYSLYLLPESLAALPILVASYLLIKAYKRPRLEAVLTAGVLIGVSCWFRANGLLLAPFLALFFPMLFVRGKRLRFAAALIGATALMIAPITIRNWISYGRFIPVSIGAGITMIEGIADYDKQGDLDCRSSMWMCKGKRRVVWSGGLRKESVEAGRRRARSGAVFPRAFRHPGKSCLVPRSDVPACRLNAAIQRFSSPEQCLQYLDRTNRSAGAKLRPSDGRDRRGSVVADAR